MEIINFEVFYFVGKYTCTLQGHVRYREAFQDLAKIAKIKVPYYSVKGEFQAKPLVLPFMAYASVILSSNLEAPKILIYSILYRARPGYPSPVYSSLYFYNRSTVRVYILDPIRVAIKFASTLCLFGRMATWYGTRYINAVQCYGLYKQDSTDT